MTSREAQILELYEAFNNRAFDDFFARVTADVDWTNDIDDSRLIGKAALRHYTLDETTALRAEFAPIHVQVLGNSRVAVLAHQTIRSASDGSVWSETRVRHIFTLEDGLVTRMDSQRDEASQDKAVTLVLSALHRAIEDHDIEAVVALFHPEARIPESLDQGLLVGHEQIRAYFLRQFVEIQVSTRLLWVHPLPDDRADAIVHVTVHDPRGDLQWEGQVSASYRLDQGLIAEMTFALLSGS
ncbi:nuclear transport factor 2 family protein [Caulobacter henricii]|uniref:SnoaL-like domain-containing protein n=1 Tax=Caulobacter henricii TaxID=69395 RepID=A0A0P0NY76_9CAUL|nr:nuclear transport factor 2 family protein [Caulobacter henricii]ALL13064.1 hypothetical protein AQ619_06705 [Caulobacter henricii]